MNKNIWILIMGFFLFQACLDDEGNYSYSDLLPIEIDSSKMSNSYRITQLDYLVVDPGVKQGADDSNLSYEWKIFQENSMLHWKADNWYNNCGSLREPVVSTNSQ